MLDDEDPDGLALARRIALDVRQLVKLGITDTAQLAARTREATICIVPTQTSGSAVRDVG